MIDENVSKEENILDNILSKLISQTLSDEGADYKTLYCDLFRGISLIIESTNTYEQTIDALKVLQCKAEEFYISQGNGP